MRERHSQLGVGSLVISIISGVLMFILFAVAGVQEASSPGGIDENSLGAAIIGLLLLALIMGELLAVALGVAALFQSGTSKTPAIIGILFSATVVGITGLLVLLGLATG